MTAAVDGELAPSRRWLRPWRAAVVVTLGLLPALMAAADASSSAPEYLATFRVSPALQAMLDDAVGALAARDRKLRATRLRIALVDLTGTAPRLAHIHGEIPVYPASVVKFVYLMAAYAWRADGRLEIDPTLDRALTRMIYHSSNRATQQVVARLTDTEPGPELPPAEYEIFRHRRYAVKRWLETLGVTTLHCIHPTYDGGGDLYGRDRQLLRDPTAAGGLGGGDGEFPNRQAMTAIGTAKLLALLATDRALAPADSATVRRRMRRDVAKQPYLVRRIAGGAARLADLEVDSKTGTWGPIYADAGIVRHASGRQLVLAVFTESSPPYRGTFIADLAMRVARDVLFPDGARPD